jgi:homoserine kinase
MKRIRAYAPAGVGNFAAGFDVLGAAVAPIDGSLWGDVVTISDVPTGGAASFTCTGPFADRLPADPEDNLVVRTRAFFEEALLKERTTAPLPPLAITLYKELPVKSGLGSSAASAVAAVVALNAWSGGPLNEARLLEVAGRAESLASGALHLDNVAPILLGGLLLVPPESLPRRLPFPPDLAVIVASPALEVATSDARRVLPKDVSLGLAVVHAQNLAAFVHALHAGDRALLRETLRDLLAEPFRAGLVRGFREAQQNALEAGALGASLSGAGPAVFAVAEDDDACAVATALESGFRSAGVAADVRICRIDERGARVLDDEAP